MESMGLDPARFEERSPITLSEGEKRRAALAGLLVDPPRAILLDEPTAGLDLQGRLALAKALAEVRARGHAVILASHDLEFVANTADRVMLLGGSDGSGGSFGSVLASGTPDAILSDPALMSRGGLPALASRGTPPHPSGADARAAFQRA